MRLLRQRLLYFYEKAGKGMQKKWVKNPSKILTFPLDISLWGCYDYQEIRVKHWEIIRGSKMTACKTAVVHTHEFQGDFRAVCSNARGLQHGMPKSGVSVREICCSRKGAS